MDIKEIKQFIDKDGRVTAYPPKRKKKIYILSYILEKIPEGKKYTEKEFGSYINEWITFNDPAIIRREMFDYFLVNRNIDGSEYEVNPLRPSLEELLEKYCR